MTFQEGARDGNLDGIKEPWETDGTPKRGTAFDRLTVYSIDDVDTAPDRNYLVKGLVAEAEISVWVGTPKCGKSFLMLHICYRLSLGLPVFGRRTRACHVLYIAAEGEAGINKRLKALRDRYGHSKNFFFIAQPADLLHDYGHLPDVIEIAQHFKANLIVIDTLSKVMSGGDENGAKDMGTFIRNVIELRYATSAHIGIVHHGTKNSGGISTRGHGSLEGAEDALFTVERIEGMNAVLKFVHGKDDAAGVAFNFALEIVNQGTDKDDETITTLIVHEDETGRPPSPAAARFGKLGDAALILFRHLETFSFHAPLSKPDPNMAGQVRAVSRSDFRKCLLDHGWFNDDEIVSLPSYSPVPDASKAGSAATKLPTWDGQLGSRSPLNGKGQKKEEKALNALKGKNIINFNRKLVWIV